MQILRLTTPVAAQNDRDVGYGQGKGNGKGGRRGEELSGGRGGMEIRWILRAMRSG